MLESRSLQLHKMPVKDEKIIETVGGVHVRSERIEFDASELVVCEGCGRANAPNRAECIYCGKAMPHAGSFAELKLREPEPWEKGFNVVISAVSDASHPGSPPIDRETFKRAMELGSPIPVVRTASLETAESARARFDGEGFRSVIVSDEELEGDRPPARLRSLSAVDGLFALTDFNTGERRDFAIDELELIVSGRLFEERSEQTLRKNRKGVTELDAGSTVKDSGVIDLYFAGEPWGFRIEETGFDFSWLGTDKSLLATENMKMLLGRLREICPKARFSDDYLGKRNFLAEIWPAEPRNDSKGVKRWNFGRSIANASVTSNRLQFTKYSRLLRCTL